MHHYGGSAVKEIVRLVNDKSYQAGSHSIKWDGSDFSSGIYLYKADAGGKSFIKKMILVQ